MTPDQIREVVKITIDELTRSKLLSPELYQTVLKTVEPKLYQYFNGDCEGVGQALRSLSDDPYLEVIFLQYRDGKTLEWIAEAFSKDVSTIKRNKKRIIYKIYELMED